MSSGKNWSTYLNMATSRPDVSTMTFNLFVRAAFTSSTPSISASFLLRASCVASTRRLPGLCPNPCPGQAYLSIREPVSLTSPGKPARGRICGRRVGPNRDLVYLYLVLASSAPVALKNGILERCIVDDIRNFIQACKLFVCKGCLTRCQAALVYAKGLVWAGLGPPAEGKTGAEAHIRAPRGPCFALDRSSLTNPNEPYGTLWCQQSPSSELPSCSQADERKSPRHRADPPWDPCSCRPTPAAARL